MNRRVPWIDALLLATGVAALALALILLVSPMFATTSAEPASAEAATAYPAALVAELNAYLAEKGPIVSSMPAHPMSRETLDEVVRLYRAHLGVSEQEALEHAAFDFRDSNLGIFALDTRLKAGGDTPESDGRALLTMACEEFPDSRVALFAFDRLIADEKKDPIEYCRARSGEESRLARYALLRLGEELWNEGDGPAAAEALLRVWLAEPERAERAFGTLEKIWNNHGDWTYPALLTTDPDYRVAIRGILELALEEARLARGCANDGASLAVAALWQSGGEPEKLDRVMNDPAAATEWRVKAAVMAAGKTGDVGAAVHALEFALDEMKGLGARWTDSQTWLALAAWGHAPDFDAPSDPAAAGKLIASRQQLQEVQSGLFSLAETYAETLDPAAQVYFHMSSARTRLARADITQAAENYENAINVGDAPILLWERAVLALAEIHAREWGAPEHAAQICAEYSKARRDSSETIEIASAGYYLAAGREDEAFFQVTELTPADSPEQAQAVGLLVRGMANLRKGARADALGDFDRIVRNYPECPFADQALFMAATTLVGEKRYADARKAFEHLANDYDTSRYAARAREYAEGLAAVELPDETQAKN